MANANSWTVPISPTNAGSTPDTTIPDYFGTMTNGPIGTTRLSKIPGADPLVYQQFQDAQGLRDTIGKSMGTYFDALSKSQGSIDNSNQQDLASLNSLFDPNGYQAGLSNIRNQRTAALKNLDQILFGDMRRSLSMGRIGSGGAGLSSYLAQMAGSQAATTRANEAYDSANQQRLDLTSLINAQQGAIGKRSSLQDSAITRLLAPIGAQTQAYGANSNALTQAVQQALMNSLIGTGTRAPQ